MINRETGEPGRGNAMTSFTGVAGSRMSGRFTQRHTIREMTRYTTGGNGCVVHRDSTEESCRRHTMTIIAHIRSRWMGGTLGRAHATTNMTLHTGTRGNL